MTSLFYLNACAKHHACRDSENKVPDLGAYRMGRMPWKEKYCL